MKSSDKQDLCRKLIALLKPRYGAAPKHTLPVLETMLYAVCLEGVSPDTANQAFARVTTEFHDLNEVRVSSFYELERLFSHYPDPSSRSMGIKNVLQYVFEKTYSFDFEVLRRKTQEQALKDLSKIKWLSPFCRAYTQQNSLDAHVLPIDERQAQALKWLGLAEPGATVDQVSESLRPFVRKADAQLFCHVLRGLATEPEISAAFVDLPSPDEAGSPIERLQELISGSRKKRKDKDREKADGHARDRKPAARSNGKPAAKPRTPAAKKPAASARVARPAPKKK